MMGKVTAAYSSSKFPSIVKTVVLIVVIVFLGLVVQQRFASEPMLKFSSFAKPKALRLVTWNIAAINNNPFEYWITSNDDAYNRIMKSVSDFIETPGDKDIQVKDVFTDKMADDLFAQFRQVGWTGVDETKAKWEKEYRNRMIISGFIKDGVLGKKRLASMPDRVTNTINTVDGSVATRPTVINCYDKGNLGSRDQWWAQWKSFMFTDDVTIVKKGSAKKQKVYEMLTPIKKSKYPAITEDEEKISLPLQTLCVAVFDAILVHMMNTIDPRWQVLRENMCANLNRKKNDRTMDILVNTYGDAHVQFLQEVAGSFLAKAKTNPVSDKFDIYAPAEMDGDRDQNSFILLRKHAFVDINEVTKEVLAELPRTAEGKVDAPVMNGDLLALTIVDPNDHTKYLVASFHGDTNGLATIPIVTAVHAYATTKKPDHKLIFGMDANTYARPDPDQQGVVAFGEFFSGKKLNSCYGKTPNPLNFTTFHARTHLQPQLNKAVSLEEKDKKGDKNPKDFILFFDADFTVLSTTKDNTGQRRYIENMVFPTLSFPSDHGITSTILIENKALGGSIGSNGALSDSQNIRGSN